MIDIELVRQQPDKVKINLAKRGVDKTILDKLIDLDQRWRSATSRLDEMRAQQNTANEKIAAALGEEKKRLIREMKEAAKNLKAAEQKLGSVSARRMKTWRSIPNLLAGDVPIGKNDQGNKIIKQVGDKREFSWQPKPHWELGQELGIIESRKAAEVAGSRFAYIKGGLVLMQFALLQFAWSVLTNDKTLKKIGGRVKKEVSDKPFVPVVPPVFIRPEVMDDMARLEPREERYHIESDNLYLIGSSEHSLGPLHMNEQFEESDLPRRYVGYSTCFRREAGSYGKDVRGILRMHQFDKLEMESFTLPADSPAEQDFLVAIQEYLMQSLELPYQVVNICTGDMGDPDARQIDIETWMPGQDCYRETHSADLMTDYQARRLGTKVKMKEGKSQYVHMNDATVLAMGRTLIAIMENYQREDGSIDVPKVLRQYLSFKRIEN